MQRERVLRFEAPDHDALARIAAAHLPLGMRELSSELELLRTIFFDTRTDDLRRKGAAVRVSIRPDGTQTLTVSVGMAQDDSGATREHADAVVPGLPPADLFQGDSEPARIIRALVDPAQLVASLEIETIRRLRRAAHEHDSRDTIDFAFDAVTVRRDGLSGELNELEVIIPGDAASVRSDFVEAIEKEYGVRLLLADTAARARALLDELSLDQLEHNVRTAREVAIIAYANGSIALCDDGESLSIPSGTGSGQDACRNVLRNVFGQPHGRIRMLDIVPGVHDRPGLEVWLAEDISTDAGDCTWMPVADVIEKVGTPYLRDARTLAALHTVARSSLAMRSNGAVPASTEPSHTAAHRIFQRAVEPARVPELLETLRARDVSPELLLNPDISRLAFDERILVFAEDDRTPLLDRVRFLAMFGERLDDFFMTRIAEFKIQVDAGDNDTSIDGLSAAQQLDVTRVRARKVLDRAYDLLTELLLPALESRGIVVHRWTDLDADEHESLRRTYAPQAEAVLTPIIADRTHPFPHMRNLRPAVAAIVRLPDSVDEHFVAIELPGGLPRFIPLSRPDEFIAIEDLIIAWLPTLYPGMTVLEASTFRVTRNGVVEYEDEPPGGILTAIEDEVARRPFGEVVRLEVEREMSATLRDRLLRELQFEMPDVPTSLSHDDIFPVDRLVDLAALHELAELDHADLRFEPITQSSPLDPDRSIFDQLHEHDVMVRFPEHSFDETVERFVDDAAGDDDVIAIKVTLYRTDAKSRLVQALARARTAGKDAFALIELKASFDEQRNIEWARSLQAAGIHVVFSPAKIKVHAKIALVVRREGSKLRRYALIGTGNLNAATSRAYTDIAILTADPALTREIGEVFNLLTGYSGATDFRHLLVSPFTMRDRFMALIDREIEHARAGRGGRIRIQMNGLADRPMIAALYRASAEGVQIDMMVREICGLRPGLPGISENIRIVSKLGRMLQHARIYCFHNAGQPEYFIGSADWRPRNLSKRVEVIVPVREDEHRLVLDRALTDILEDEEAWTLRGDGSYVKGEETVSG